MQQSRCTFSQNRMHVIEITDFLDSFQDYWKLSKKVCYVNVMHSFLPPLHELFSPPGKPPRFFTPLPFAHWRHSCESLRAFFLMYFALFAFTEQLSSSVFDHFFVSIYEAMGDLVLCSIVMYNNRQTESGLMKRKFALISPKYQTSCIDAALQTMWTLELRQTLNKSHFQYKRKGLVNCIFKPCSTKLYSEV